MVAASAIGSPGLLLRSNIPDPHQRIGKRSFIHPVNATVAQMPQRVDPFYGAPQSIYSDEFNFRNGVDGPVGYKLEVPPLHPGMSSGVIPGHGETQINNMAGLPHMQSVIALLRDGFHPKAPAARSPSATTAAGTGLPRQRLPLEGHPRSLPHHGRNPVCRRCRKVRLMHLDSDWYTNWTDAKAAIDQLPMAPHRVRLFTAHQMGGCAMGSNPQNSVVNGFGEHHHVGNLSVHDASIFPTSIGQTRSCRFTLWPQETARDWRKDCPDQPANAARRGDWHWDDRASWKG
ncbi:GMC oxidoreductase [Marinobacter adhaerens]|uniref:GMC oxidoreductase n=1 Tax=Marinobacter adhaerens TaxID=1033846 RepID=UPI00311A9F8A